MQSPRTRLIVGATLCSVAVLGIGLWLVLRPRAPTLEKAGGTILVYELETAVDSAEGYSPAAMADAIQRRIDPDGAKGMKVRPEGHDRFEIAIPQGPQHAEDVQHVKDIVVQSGVLEFRILANTQDDRVAIDAVTKYLDGLDDPATPEQERARRKEELDLRAEQGKPPLVPPGPLELEPGQTGFYEGAKGRFKYSWLELGNAERVALEVNNASEKNGSARWQLAAAARKQGKALILPDLAQLLYSRECLSHRLLADERQSKKYDYFLLARDPVPGKEITGKYLASVRPGIDHATEPCLLFEFDDKGGTLFYEVTSENLPTGSDAARFYRHLAIILDGQIMSAPRLMSAISKHGQITGKEVDSLAGILRAGALPASLKPLPVSETTVGPQR
jgi:preprotein translocase subunit SecD